MHILVSTLKDLKKSGITQEEFARRIGKKQSYISMLLHRLERGRLVPADICPKIEEATGGKITCHDLRPDVFGAAPVRRRRAA